MAFTAMELMADHSQRGWILIGMAECCASKGFEATTVAEVCAAAGVPRGAFEREFADLDECLGAAVESLLAEAWTRLDGLRSSPERTWGSSLRGGTAALLRLAAERPALARVALLEAPAVGGRAAVLHASARATLLDFLERGREPAGATVPESAARGALAGVEALLAREALAGRTADLGALTPDVAYMLAVPFLGVDAAQQLAGTAARRGHLRAVA